MRICCIADLHGNLPQIPDCDLLLIGGDICEHGNPWFQLSWLASDFDQWLHAISKRGIRVVGVAGNHDWPFQNFPHLIQPLRWHYLRDDHVYRNGMKIYGSPWQMRFMDWAFNADEPVLEAAWSLIPNDTDILLLHGPPHGCGDKTVDRILAGSPSLTKRILEIKPKLVVCGHIHESAGIYRLGESIVVNASIVDRDYRVARDPFVLELGDGFTRSDGENPGGVS